MASSSEEPQQTQDIVDEKFCEEETEEESVEKVHKRKRSESSGSEKRAKRSKRRKVDRTKQGWIFVGFPPEAVNEIRAATKGSKDQDELMEEMKKIITEGKTAHRIIEGERVKIAPTEEERAEERRAYRQEYRQQDHVKEKRKEKNQSEEEKKKRVNYQRLPEVKQRKRELAKAKRQLAKEIKRQHPEIYRKAEEKVRGEITLPLPSLKKRGSRWAPREAWITS